MVAGKLWRPNNCLHWKLQVMSPLVSLTTQFSFFLFLFAWKVFSGLMALHTSLCCAESSASTPQVTSLWICREPSPLACHVNVSQGDAHTCCLFVFAFPAMFPRMVLLRGVRGFCSFVTWPCPQLSSCGLRGHLMTWASLVFCVQ